MARCLSQNASISFATFCGDESGADLATSHVFSSTRSRVELADGESVPPESSISISGESS